MEFPAGWSASVWKEAITEQLQTWSGCLATASHLAVGWPGRQVCVLTPSQQPYVGPQADAASALLADVSLGLLSLQSAHQGQPVRGAPLPQSPATHC